MRAFFGELGDRFVGGSDFLSPANRGKEWSEGAFNRVCN